MTSIPLIDLGVQYRSIQRELDEAIQRVIAASHFILGPDVKAFEDEMARYIGLPHAVGVASGTDALEMALLGLGIGTGDEVITTPFTFIATAEAITHVGATPVFVDIDPVTYCIDPAKIEAKITPKTKALLPVHLYGHPAEMDAIMEIARRHNLKVVEDCAQSLGAEYKGQKVGSIGDAGCLSFFPGKNLGCFGDGGMVVTRHETVFETVKMLRHHGSKVKYHHALSGFNSRLDTLQAAVLRIKLQYLGEWNQKRRDKAALYAKALSGSAMVAPPAVASHVLHSFNYYTVRTKNRAAVAEALKQAGIGHMVYYPLSLHLQEVYRPLGYRAGDLPNAERAQDEVLSLPMFPELTDEQIQTIGRCLGGHA